MTARAYTVPTDAPEADGTYLGMKQRLVVVTVEAGGSGLGYTYSAGAIAELVTGTLRRRCTGATSSTFLIVTA